MKAKELQGKLLDIESLLDRRAKISDDQRLEIIGLREKVHRLKSDKQELEAERQRLTAQVDHLTKKLSSK